VVHLPARHPALLFTAILCVSAFLAAIALWTFSHARTPFDYMVVGTLGAAVILAGIFAIFVKRRWL
jgi:hypothetical protein